MNGVKVLNGHLAELQRLCSSRDTAGVNSALIGSKLAMVRIPSLVNPADTSPDCVKERALATSILEEAVLFYVETDSEAFNRNMQQLKVLYYDFGQLSVSRRSTTMLGLNLLKLLMEGRVVELFTELERIPQSARDSPQVRVDAPSHALSYFFLSSLSSHILIFCS